MSYVNFSEVVLIEKIIFQSNFNNKSNFLVNFDGILYTAYGRYYPWLAEKISVVLYGKSNKEKKILFVESCVPVLKKYIDSFCAFLVASNIKGLPLRKIVLLKNYFGDALVDIFYTEQFSILVEQNFFTEEGIEEIKKKLKEIKSYSELHIELYNKGLSYSSVKKIYKLYKNDSLAILKENPYKIMESIGFGFKTADKIAQEYGINKEDFIRIEASVLYIISESQLLGHTYIRKDELLEKIQKLLEFSFQEIEFDQIIKQLVKDEKLSLISDTFVCLKMVYEYEKYVFDFFSKNYTYNVCSTSLYKENSTLNNEQKTAVLGALQNKYSIITGPAGTGKSTIINSIYNYLINNNKKVLIITPTGRAAQRIREMYKDMTVMTIHKCLGINYLKQIQEGKFLYIDEFLPYDHIIIDESSMVDSFLFYGILKKMNFKTGLTCIGDAYQLSPIGVGAIFSVLVRYNLIPVFRLQEVHRQKQDSELLTIAYAISQGTVPKISLQKTKDCYFISVEKNYLVDTLKPLLDKYYVTFEKKISIQFISFLHRGLTGIAKINIFIQSYLQEKRNSIADKKILGLFFLFDKVITVKNNYALGVFNGEIGYITEGDETYAKVKYDDKEVIFSKDNAFLLELGYVISVHKSQGSEFEVVAVFLFIEQYILLDRKSLYTALTRTKNQVIIIGEKKALYCAVKNREKIERKTVFELVINNNF